MSKCNLKPEIKQIAITNTLKINNEAYVDIWLEDVYKCRDFLGRVTISFLDIFDKGKPDDKRYKDENFEVNYRPKIYSGSESFINVFDIDADLDYEVWFYPENYTKDLNIKKTDKEFQKDQKIKIFEDILKEHKNNEGFKYEIRKTILNIPNSINRFFGFDNKDFEIIREVDTLKGLAESIDSLENEIKNFYILDQFGEYRIINSYLSKLTVKTVSNENAESIKTNSVEKILRQKRTDIDKVEIGIGDTFEGLIHYIKCMRFSSYDNTKKKRILLSPDYIMLNRKGNVFEHTIYLACILMNKETENEIIYQKLLDKINQNLIDNINENFEMKPNIEKENILIVATTKREGSINDKESFREKNSSRIRLISDLDKNSNREENNKKSKNEEKINLNIKPNKENSVIKKNRKKDVLIEKIESVKYFLNFLN